MAEKRRHERLPMRLGILCRKIGQSAETFYRGQTLNISTGGLFFETADGEDGVFNQGDLLNVELSVPPTNGLLEFGGRISSFARVVRACGLSQGRVSPAGPPNKVGVAVQFCQHPKLWE